MERLGVERTRQEVARADLLLSVFDASSGEFTPPVAAAHLENAAAELARWEVFAEELRLAHLALAGIVGEFTADDLLGEIFSRFCIGK